MYEYIVIEIVVEYYPCLFFITVGMDIHIEAITMTS